MASLALGIVGNIVAPGVGGIIGAALGSVIDSQLTYPAIAGKQTFVGPRLDDRKLQVASEGSPIRQCMGPDLAEPATIIWCTDLIEASHSESQGGKGGSGGANITNYTYSVHLAAGICDGPINRVKRITGNAKTIYHFRAAVNYSSNLISATVEQTYTWFGMQQVVDKTYMKLSTSLAGPDLTAIHVGDSVTVGGFANGGNNGTFTCTRMDEDGSGTYAWFENDDAVTEAAGATVTIVSDPVLWDTSMVEDIRIYLGTPSQTADSLIQAYVGVDDTPAYRNHAYVVLQGLQLGPFGNVAPQLKIEFEADNTLTIADAIGKVMTRAGRTSDEWNTDDVDGSLHGYTVEGPVTGEAQLEPIMMFDDILCGEDNGVLRFFERGTEDVVTVTEDMVAAHASGEPAPSEPQVSDVAGFDLPQEVTVRFIDYKKGYQAGSVNKRRINKVTDKVISLDVPLVMNATQAGKIATRNLWRPWSDRFTASISLPPSLITVQEGDIVRVQQRDTENYYRVRVHELTRGYNFILQAKGVIESTGTFSFTDPPDQDPVYTPPPIYVPPPLTSMLLDIGPLTEEDASTPTYYMGVCTTDILSIWAGAAAYISPNGSNYSLLEALPQECTICQALTVLPNGHSRYWDVSGTVDVRMLQGTLSSKTELEVLSGANHMWLGGEVIAFQNATLIAPNTYRLSMLLRGRRNTESLGQRDSHAIGDMGILLDAYLTAKTYSLSILHLDKLYKFVPSGALLSDVPTLTRALEGGSMKPFSPTHMTATRDGSNNITYDWVRRTRVPIRLFSGQCPNPDNMEKYEIDILDGLGVVVRTLTVEDATTVDYSAADQTTDGFTPGDPIQINAYMVNDSVGRGNPLVVTL